MIQVANLIKTYGPIEALRGVSFRISSGEIVGMLGPNGAGKTTVLKILTGYLQPDEGSVVVDDIDVLLQPRRVQERIGYLPENAPLYPELSVQSYLKMMAELRRIPEETERERISEAVFATGLEDQLIRPIGQLSKGFRQRVGLAQAILHQPRILILDEPTIGLDPTQIVEIRRLIRRLAEHTTVLFSTHILSEVEAICDRVIILINGQIKADARLSELATTSDAILVLEDEGERVQKALEGLDDVQEVEMRRTPEGYTAFRVMGRREVYGADLCPLLYDLARQEGWTLRELQPDSRTLEMVFNELATAS